MIHSLSDVKTENIGPNTDVWQYSIILNGARIGDNCNINCHVFIENDVIIGCNVTVKSGVFLWNGLRIGNNVFIGPNVTFTNDIRPRSKQYPIDFEKTFIDDFASIGAGSIVMGGCKIGKFAMIGAGSLVIGDVPDRALVYGSPAKIMGWLNDNGTKMINEDDKLIDSLGNFWKEIDGKLEKV
jgi:UDP-2-acetamido-3-amino-2,3-dideoxy-glucuronate N-acetyltransferase